LIASVIVGGAFLLFPTSLAAFYMDVNNPNNATTLHLTILLFMITAFSQAFDGFRNIFIGILRGLFDTRFPMHMSLVTIWMIGMPLSYVLAFPLHYGAVGFVMGGALGMLSGAALMMHRWYKISNKY
ncbi:MAG: MATE family efflux transporter, partial [Pseudomonadota bacterium]|nr:MATE family efflux transporter [Pseudomonadota bacterium]